MTKNVIEATSAVIEEVIVVKARDLVIFCSNRYEHGRQVRSWQKLRACQRVVVEAEDLVVYSFQTGALVTGDEIVTEVRLTNRCERD